MELHSPLVLRCLRRAAPFLALLVGSILFRLPHLMNAAGANSDVTIVGLQARHMLRGERSWYLWGAGYQSSVDAVLTAAAFAVAGDGPLTLMMVPLLGHLLLTWFVWDVLRRRIGPASGTLATLPLVVAPQIVNGVALYSPRQWAVTAVFGALWLLDGAVGSRGPRLRAGLGVALGVVAIYLDLFTVQFLVGLAVFALAVCVEAGTRRDVLRQVGSCALGGLLGALFVAYAWSDPNASTGQAQATMAKLAWNFRLLSHDCLPWALLARIYAVGATRWFRPWDWGPAFRVVQYTGAGLLVAGIAFGGLAVVSRRIPKEVRRLGVLGALTTVCSIGAFLVSVRPSTVASARYLAPIIWTAPFALAPAAFLLGPRRFAVMLTPYLVASAIAGWYAEPSYVRGPLPVLAARGTARDEMLLGAELARRSVRHATADYWLAYRLTYLLHERPIVSPLSALDARYLPYTLAFNAAPVVAYVFHPSEPDVSAADYEQTFRRSGTPYERFEAGSYTVLVLRSTSWVFSDDRGEGVLSMRDVGPGPSPASRRIAVELRRGDVRSIGSGLRVTVDRDRPFTTRLDFVLDGPEGREVFEGMTTSPFNPFGRGTRHPVGEPGRPTPWRMIFRDRT